MKGTKEPEKWIQGAIKRPGALTRKAKAAGKSVSEFISQVKKSPGKYPTRTVRQANLAKTLARFARRKK